MGYIRTTFVEFRCSGILLIESSTQEVKNRSTSGIKVPKNSFGFRFFDILSTTVVYNGKKVKLSSGRINESPMYYYGGQLYTVEELKRDFPNELTLIRDLENNVFNKVIHCRTGNWQPFKKSDILIAVT